MKGDAIMAKEERKRMLDISVFGPNTQYSEIHDQDHKGLDPHAHDIHKDKTYGEARPLTDDEQAAYDSFKED